MVMYLSCMSYHVRCLIDYCGSQHILYAEARSRSNVFCIHAYKQNITEIYSHYPECCPNNRFQKNLPKQIMLLSRKH